MEKQYIIVFTVSFIRSRKNTSIQVASYANFIYD